MFYSVNLAELFRDTAVYVDKIFKGSKLADLPVKQPAKFDLIINLKTARRSGSSFRQQRSFEGVDLRPSGGKERQGLHVDARKSPPSWG
jgi:ABC-type uncharacterized transport system substrate-binding protein